MRLFHFFLDTGPVLHLASSDRPPSTLEDRVGKSEACVMIGVWLSIAGF